jgi:hypothetical protein
MGAVVCFVDAKLVAGMANSVININTVANPTLNFFIIEDSLSVYRLRETKAIYHRSPLVHNLYSLLVTKCLFKSDNRHD